MTTDVFNPVGYTFQLLGVAVPSEAINMTNGVQAPQYRILHPGTELVWLGVGATAEEAIANARPATNVATPGLPIMPGTDEIVEFGKKTFFAAYCQSSTQPIYITPGLGL